MRSRAFQKMLTAVCVAVLLGATTPPEAPVADAAMRGDVDTVRVLLRSGADVNEAQGDGMTALHWAARNDDVELAEVLIYAGGDLDAGTRIGRYTPLHVAAREGNSRVVEALLEAGSSPEAVTTNSGATPLHLAASSGDSRIVSQLIEHGADVEARDAKWGQTPLIFAAAMNRVEVIELLLGAGVDPNQASRAVDVVEMSKADSEADSRMNELLADFKEREGGGPGWLPTPSQVQAAVDLSREVQANWPNVPKKDDEQDDEDEEERPVSYAEQVGAWGGLAPLHHAIRQGHVEAALALLEAGADIDQTIGDGSTPLLMASLSGQWDLASVLLEWGADPTIASSAGTTPLYAILEREWEARAAYGHPTEHQRQETTHLQMMERLLEAGADPDARLNKHLWYMEYTFSVLGGSGINLKGATPFWRAAYALDLAALRLLSDYGADPDVRTMKPPRRRNRQQREEKEKPVEEPEASGEDTASEDGPAEDEVSEEATEEAADSQAGEAEEAEEEEAAEAEEAEAEEDEEEEDKSGLPPIPTDGPAIHAIHAASGVGYGQRFAGNAHRYVPNGWLPAVKFLVEEMGADVNARDANGYTALHHAASRGDAEMVVYLVEHGADVTVVSRKGETVADMANGPQQRVRPFPEVVALLEQLGSENNHNCVSCE